VALIGILSSSGMRNTHTAEAGFTF
jgi:hypothetical protein